MYTSGGVLTGTKLHGEIYCGQRVPHERSSAVDPENYLQHPSQADPPMTALTCENYGSTKKCMAVTNKTLNNIILNAS